MRVFHCDHCGQLVFFENTRCVRCNHRLAYLPDLQLIGSLDGDDEDASRPWQSPLPKASGRSYRLCANYAREQVCNWAVPAEDPSALCESCRLTPSLPDLSKPGRKEQWYRIEAAKRRLVYSLISLGLPLTGKTSDAPHGLAFEYVNDGETPDGSPAFTGHCGGVIRLNLAEADDAERERRRCLLREPYRTLLGHFRHESGHYYWDLLIRDDPARLQTFRYLFGDDQQDYAAALRRNYDQGPPPDWRQRYISAYASCHPWEDWAESWAHYLHMTDALETAAVCGVRLAPRRADEPTLEAAHQPARESGFDELLGAWFPLTYMLNNFNRGLGLADAYPFLLVTPAVEKLRFIHGVVHPSVPAVTPA
jgi:hypothetical protein